MHFIAVLFINSFIFLAVSMTEYSQFHKLVIIGKIKVEEAIRQKQKRFLKLP